MTVSERYDSVREKARQIFERNQTIRCPFFDSEITLNSDGFHHLQFSDRRERNKTGQLLKFNLIPPAIQVIKKSGTVQEYRKNVEPIDRPAGNDGFHRAKTVEYWGFVAIVNQDQPIKIKVIIRRVGDGKRILWSVMPAVKLRQDRLDLIRALATKGIEND